jgi:cardiolipin synthase A/B
MRRLKIAALSSTVLAMTSCTVAMHGAAAEHTREAHGFAKGSKGKDKGRRTHLHGPANLIVEPDQGLSSTYALISSAHKTLDMTMYELVDTTAEHDLADAAHRGVKVRVILDEQREKKENTAAYDYLSGHGVKVVWAASAYAATHQKSIVVDGAKAAILTYNLTSRYYSTSRDVAIVDTDAADVAAIEKVFDADLTGASVRPGDGDDLVWSPTDSQTQLLDLIKGAKHTLLIENEEMADSTVVNALEDAAKRGITVRVVMTSDGTYDREFGDLTKAGAQVATYDPDSSLYIHAKIILADYGLSGARAFVGSENFSVYSLTKNRELGLVTTDHAVLATLHEALTSDYSGGAQFS